jgi:hypothetical protein
MGVLEAVRAKKLATVTASIRYSETLEEKTRRAAQATKAMLKDGPSNVEAVYAEEHTLRTLYYRMLEEYYGKKNFAVSNDMDNKALALWGRVKAKCHDAGVDPETFMRAQFVWFHKSFGKAPTIVQLTTATAVARASEFSPADSKKKVIGNNINANVDFASIMRNSENQMQDLMRAQGYSREEVYINLVIPGLFSFPKEFLKADPVYLKVINER